MAGGGKAKTNKDREMASDLVKRGYPHGRRFGKTLAPPVPPFDSVGSAAYRRLRSKGTTHAPQRHR